LDGSLKEKKVKPGKTHIPMGKMSGKGSGKTRRDAAVATGTPTGGGTLKITKGSVKVTHGSMSKYK
jgi:hypothetical protein